MAAEVERMPVIPDSRGQISHDAEDFSRGEAAGERAAREPEVVVAVEAHGRIEVDRARSSRHELRIAEDHVAVAAEAGLIEPAAAVHEVVRRVDVRAGVGFQPQLHAGNTARRRHRHGGKREVPRRLRNRAWLRRRTHQQRVERVSCRSRTSGRYCGGAPACCRRAAIAAHGPARIRPCLFPARATRARAVWCRPRRRRRRTGSSETAYPHRHPRP